MVSGPANGRSAGGLTAPPYNAVAMLAKLRWLKRLVLDLPHQVKLVYCLLFDPRVPVANKAAVGAALTLIVSPLDLPAWVPVVGEMDAIALALAAGHLFVASAPAAVVEEQERLIRQRRSRFDLDVERGRWLATGLARRLHLAPEPIDDRELPGIVLASHPAPPDERSLGVGA